MDSFEAQKMSGEDLDLGIAWRTLSPDSWLSPYETITTSSWSIDPQYDDGQLSLYQTDFTPNGAVAWIRGGTRGFIYRIMNRITSSGGRTGIRWVDLYITS